MSSDEAEIQTQVHLMLKLMFLFMELSGHPVDTAVDTKWALHQSRSFKPPAAFSPPLI